jgi:hypothetical protein
MPAFLLTGRRDGAGTAFSAAEKIYFAAHETFPSC